MLRTLYDIHHKREDGINKRYAQDVSMSGVSAIKYVLTQDHLDDHQCLTRLEPGIEIVADGGAVKDQARFETIIGIQVDGVVVDRECNDPYDGECDCRVWRELVQSLPTAAS